MFHTCITNTVVCSSHSLYMKPSSEPFPGIQQTNLDKRTHWWNFTSSSSTDFDFPLPVLSNSTLSFSPSLSSGMPLKYTRILIAPTISLLNTLPFAFAYQKQKITQGIWNYINISMKIMSPSLFISIRAPASFLPYPPDSDSVQLHQNHWCSIQSRALNARATMKTRYKDDDLLWVDCCIMTSQLCTAVGAGK